MSEPAHVDVCALLARVEALRTTVAEAAPAGGEALDPTWRASADNLVRYLALRHQDLRELQRDLSVLGISSLGRSEADVTATLSRVHDALSALVASGVRTVAIPDGHAVLEAHTDALFGPAPTGRRVRILLTASTDMAHDAARVRALLAAGTDVVRINCAHDGPEVWRAIARHVREAAAELGRPCRILVDLGGPKLRTGPLAPGKGVVEWHAHRDEVGRILRPARVWLGRAAAAPAGVDAVVPSVDLRHHLLHPGDGLRLVDVRGRRRTLRVESVSPEGVLLLADRAAWVAAGALRRVRNGRLGPEIASVDALPPRVVPLRLRVGDHLRMTGENELGGIDAQGPHIPITLPEALTALRVGDPVLFDDGSIASEVVDVGSAGVVVRITRAAPGGSALRSDKGVNLPSTPLPVSALTEHDLACLDATVGVADMFGLSFVRTPEDVGVLRAALAERGRSDLGIVLKIETQEGFAALPKILVEAMKGERVGVMIARGDLAVECGFERLAEVQEEILWVCEAARVPVVWATQVLDTLARRGIATRAEVTDAAAGQRAECVMLNKGPHAELAVRMLDDILRRMATHQEKKTSMLRQLHSLVAPGA
jgi:pyruvate kinase